MKILFINPSIDKSSEDYIWASSLTHNLFGKMTVLPKLAPMVLAAVTPPEHEFRYLDEDIEDLNIETEEADLIAITGMTVQADRAYEISDAFRKRGFPVIMGGIHVSSCPEEAAEHADAIFTGEGENSWPVMLEDFKNGRLKARYDVADYPPVTTLISPRVDIIKHEFYSMYPIQATKGCPYDCEFCCIKFSSGHRYRMKPVEQVAEEIRAFEKYNKGTLKKRYHFVDDNLYVNREYTISLLKAIRDLNIQWMGMGSLNTTGDEEVLKLMAESGCRSYSIGFESISEASLKEANKKTNQVAEYQEAVKKMAKYGIIPAGYFIFGFDSDDAEIFKRTTDFTKENHIVNPYFNILTPFPGTKLYDRVKDRITDHTWKHYGSLRCVFQPEKLSIREVEKGSYGASREVAKLDIMKEQMVWFWSNGPWESNPPMTFKERLFLRAVAFKVRRHRELKDFLIWVARQKNAVDLFQNVSSATFSYMARKFVVDDREI